MRRRPRQESAPFRTPEIDGDVHDALQASLRVLIGIEDRRTIVHCAADAVVVGVQARVLDDAVAVVVDPVAPFRCTGMDRRVAVVAVPGVARVAVRIAIPFEPEQEDLARIRPCGRVMRRDPSENFPEAVSVQVSNDRQHAAQLVVALGQRIGPGRDPSARGHPRHPGVSGPAVARTAHRPRPTRPRVPRASAFRLVGRRAGWSSHSPAAGTRLPRMPGKGRRASTRRLAPSRHPPPARQHSLNPPATRSPARFLHPMSNPGLTD